MYRLLSEMKICPWARAAPRMKTHARQYSRASRNTETGGQASVFYSEKTTRRGAVRAEAADRKPAFMVVPWCEPPGQFARPFPRNKPGELLLLLPFFPSSGIEILPGCCFSFRVSRRWGWWCWGVGYIALNGEFGNGDCFFFLGSGIDGDGLSFFCNPGFWNAWCYSCICIC